ncbi:hypothetical protein LA080_004032 [Diaporthe eres]|nr:hypothetical protein LA080_004032 [Diaporthe eres]
MKYIKLIIAALMGNSFSLAAPTRAEDTIRGLPGNYTMVDIQWEVPISADRTDTVTGTIEDVIRHLEFVAPDILDSQHVPTPGLEPTSVPVPFDGALVKTPDPSKVSCDPYGAGGTKDNYSDGIRYLKTVPGKPTNGGKSCGRVSCSYGAAIWWCNGNANNFTLDSYSMIADGAQTVIDRCPANSVGQEKGRNTEELYI